MVIKKRILILTLIAFIINVMLPFFVSYDGYTARAEAFFGDKIPICTANGFKWVSAGDLQNNKNLPKHESRYKCPLCYVSVHGVNKIMPDSVADAEYSTAVNILSYDLFNEVVQIQSFNISKSSRAPPFSVVL